MRTLVAALSVACLMSGALVEPAFSQPRPPSHHHVAHQRYVRHATHACVRHKANNGTVIGAVAGGVLGNLVGGHGAGGTIIGAGAGAVAGHQIAKNNARSSC